MKTDDIPENDYESISSAAKVVKDMCDAQEMKVLVLQPFSNFEGWPKDSEERTKAFEKAKGWIEIMKSLGTDMLQVGASDSTGISSSLDECAEDLAELADLLAPHGFKLAYENWCWATNAPTWKDAWKVVQRAGRDNIGLCLDTFQIAGSEWADPTTTSGLIENTEPTSAEARNARFEASLEKLSKSVPKEKIYFLQISDAYQMKPPLKPKPENGLRPKGRWSHDFRPLPFGNGYLPVKMVTKAVLKTGYQGWLSMEVFDSKTGSDLDLAAEAKQGMKACQQLVEAASS